MIIQIARLAKWWFGLQALSVVLGLVTIAASIGWSLIHHTAHTTQPAQKASVPRELPKLPFGVPTNRATLLAFGLVLLLGIATSTVAWWALRKGWRSAQFWAITASVFSLFQIGLGTLCGLAGLAAFWSKEAVDAMALTGTAKPPERVAGDGTSKFLDIGAQAIALVAFFAASYFWGKWAQNAGLIRPRGFLGEFSFWGAIYASVFVHELGHLLAGMKMKMTLRAFAVGPVAGQFRRGRWRLALNPMGFLGGGQVAMVPLHLENLPARFSYMIFAGPFFSLLGGVAALAGALSAPGSPWAGAWRFLALMGTMCMIDFIINLIPLRPEGAYSDGARLLQIRKGGPWADEYTAFAMVASSLVTDLRPSQFDLPLLERVAQFHRSGEKGSQVRLFIAMHHLESGHAAEAITAWREAAELHPEASADGSAEYAFMEASVAGDAQRARNWWRRVEAKGDSKREVDYWRGLAAVLAVEGDYTGAGQALAKADTFAHNLPSVGAYEYERWSLEVVRHQLTQRRPPASPTPEPLHATITAKLPEQPAEQTPELTRF